MNVNLRILALLFELLCIVSVAKTLDTQTTGFCNQLQNITMETDCGICSKNRCPHNYIQLTEDKVGLTCKPDRIVDDSFVSPFNPFETSDYEEDNLFDFLSSIFPRCYHKCLLSIDVATCCEGYWGESCTECPGGAKNSCKKHGVCNGGIDGDGTCTCENGFTGFACEQCADPMNYGLNCSNQCECVNGRCNNGPMGDGSCDCDDGFSGTLCDKVISCDTMNCGTHAHCIADANTNMTCMCHYGYTGDGYTCSEINLCEISTPCDHNATCRSTGPMTNTCDCLDGWEGDGVVCREIDPCSTSNYGLCDQETTVCVKTGPGQNTCECADGYTNFKSVGEPCELIDLCALNSSLCHPRANCSMVGVGDYACTCWDGYKGDGVDSCLGNVVQELVQLNQVGDLQDQLSYTLEWIHLTYGTELARHGPFTVFAVINSGWNTALTSKFDAEMKKQAIRHHILPTALTLDQLKNTTIFHTLEGSTAELYYQRSTLFFRLQGDRSSARVIRGDIRSNNAIIHIIDTPMDKNPIVKGSTQKSVFDILKGDGRFNRLEKLLKSSGIEDNLTDTNKEFTVFAPNNAAWDSQLEGTFQYLISNQGKGKLIEILNNHVVIGTPIRAIDLINMRSFTSVGHTNTQVCVEAGTGQIKLNNKINITQTDIFGKNGLIHYIDGILIPSSVDSILPHRCDVVINRTTMGPCGVCEGELSCYGDDMPLNKTTPCRYWIPVQQGSTKRYTRIDGCSMSCNRTYRSPSCCDGFYGRDCYPCPGGFQNQCNGNGYCRDGINDDGSCSCTAQYTGSGCQLCKDEDKYGQFCNNSCSCLKGECDNRVTGSLGSCKPNSCLKGYMGKNCDKQIRKCLSINCHAHASCIATPLPIQVRRSWLYFPTIKRCVCQSGYTGSGAVCKEINNCLSPRKSRCHKQATCTKTGPGRNTCTCNYGYLGDGKSCRRVAVCTNSTHCHQHAHCAQTSPGMKSCVCDSGYFGNGSTCDTIDKCATKNGGCYTGEVNATCSMNGTQVNCTCPTNYGGGGKHCYGTVAYEIRDHPLLNSLDVVIRKLDKQEDFLENLDEQFTLLAPNSRALRTFLDKKNDDYWENDENILELIGHHTISGKQTLKQLQALSSVQTIAGELADDASASVLNITIVNKMTYVGAAAILKGDLPAVNGIIHVVSQVLETKSSEWFNPTIDQVLSKYSNLSNFRQLCVDNSYYDVLEDMDNYTLFVPYNGAFDKESNILQSWTRVLRHLTLQGTYKLDILKHKQSVKSILNTTQEESVIDIRVQNGLVVLDKTVKILQGDIKTRFGIMHIIDTLLEPPVPPTCDKDNGGCHHNAICSQNDDGVQCSCDIGYEGDGYLCISKCEVKNGGCHHLAYCTVAEEDGSVQCRCPEEYEGDGSICMYPDDPDNPCNVNNGGCDINAECNIRFMDDTMHVLCRCGDGYVGNGYRCHGNLWDTMVTIKTTEVFYNVIEHMAVNDQAVREVIGMLRDTEKYWTVFAPASQNIMELWNVQISQTTGSEKLFIKDYIFPGRMNLTSMAINSTTSLTMVSGRVSELSKMVYDSPEIIVTFADVRLMSSNISAVNGIIYILEEILPAYDGQRFAYLRSPKSSGSVIGAVIGVIACIAVIVIFVVLVVKKKDDLYPYVAQLSNGAYRFRRFFTSPGDDESTVKYSNDDDDVNIPKGCHSNMAFQSADDDNDIIVDKDL